MCAGISTSGSALMLAEYMTSAYSLITFIQHLKIWLFRNLS